MRAIPYLRQASSLLPSRHEDFVPENSLARYVAAFVARLEITELSLTCGNTGAPHFPAEIMLAILMYAFIKGISSTRKIEEALKDSMSFIYTADGKTPDPAAISRFGCRAAPYFDGCMDQLLVMAAKDGILNCEDVFVGGTKPKASASAAALSPARKSAR
jgi:transposase